MGKLLIGILIGSAATVAVFAFLDAGEQAQSPQALEVSLPSIDPEITEIRESPAQTQSVAPTARVSSEAEITSSAAGTLAERIATQRQLIDDAQAELIELYKSSAVAELGPVITPLPLPQEFDWLGVNLFRERMQREPIDPLWAGSSEARLWDYIGSQSQLTQAYGTPTIRCHSTRCQLTWMSYASDKTKAEALSDFSALRDEIEVRLPGVFDCPLCPVELNVQDGVTTVVWGLTASDE